MELGKVLVLKFGEVQKKYIVFSTFTIIGGLILSRTHNKLRGFGESSSCERDLIFTWFVSFAWRKPLV